ncbi:MAG: hypothetical protein AAF501_09375 [Pseudomonadota bacterium]
MKATSRILILIAAAVLTACGGATPGASLAPRVEAERHPAKRMYVRYGAANYFVDIRYVDIINESVIAVRDNGGKIDGRERLTVPATVGIPTGEPFSSSSFKSLVVSIAGHIRETAKICDSGRQMALRLNSEGETQATYRAQKNAWVVFAACPAASTG